MRRQQERVAVCFVFVCVAFFLIILSSGRRRIESLHRKQLAKAVEAKFVNLVKKTQGISRLLESTCVGRTTCLDVRDEIVECGGGRKVRRATKKDSILLSHGFLKTPERLTISAADTSKWEMDFSTIPDGATKTIIEEMFASGALRIASDSAARILILGIGGGFLVPYLRHLFPNMHFTVVESNEQLYELTSKWYFLTADQNVNVVHQDGAHYLKDSVEQEHAYDAIILDSCLVDIAEDTLCPSRTYLHQEPISHMAQLVGEPGVVVVHFVHESKFPLKLINNITEQFNQSFAYSKVKQSNGRNNYVITFSQFKHMELYADLANIPISVCE
ncbi:hypothetical protein Q1695_014097 [Nippostrongylus brasiliensis]|nr:hypothetical protein Q1695_014097 [Nippostrongylus brasiliensis]